jgi:outer membrane immunogenic protein
MKRVLAGIGLVALVAAPAAAADLPGRPYQAPAYYPQYSWTGFYAGLHGGYGWGDLSGVDLSGGFVGGQVGYNWQAGASPWVFGLEVDSAWANLGSSNGVAGPGLLVAVDSDVNYIGSFRGRIGYAWDRTLLYATGGVAWANNQVTVAVTSGPFFAGLSDSKFHVGGTIGAGVEYAFTPYLSGKAEYRYTAYGSESYFGNLGGVKLDIDTHAVMIGANYHFRP